MNAARSLEIPSWAPKLVGSLAQTSYAEEVVRPQEIFGAHANAIRRVATDERMREVWNEIYRRQGGVSRSGLYVHPARADRVRASPHFRAVEDVPGQVDERDRIQDQAAAVLFLIATGHSLWDRRFGVGPRIRTESEVNEEITELRELADSHQKMPTGMLDLVTGKWPGLSVISPPSSATVPIIYAPTPLTLGSSRERAAGLETIGIGG